jgi:hypothetical protein
VPSALGGSTTGGVSVLPTAANTPSSSSPPSPNKEQGMSFSRHPYVLKSMPGELYGISASQLLLWLASKPLCAHVRQLCFLQLCMALL